MLYARPDHLREVATALGSPQSGMPFFADAVLCDNDLSKRFVRLHMAIPKQCTDGQGKLDPAPDLRHRLGISDASRGTRSDSSLV